MGGCVVIARNRPRSRPEPSDAGDGGLFATIGLAFLAFLVLLGVVVVVGHWYGAGAGQLAGALGVAVIVIAAVRRSLRGGRR
jgi:hypothetical protein